MKKQLYGSKSLKREFPDEASCLNFLFDLAHSRSCGCGGTYNPMFGVIADKLEGRRQFQCSKCRFQIAPMADTIFEKSTTPLTTWFQALLAFSNAKSGISGYELQREIETTYKTAWRILKLVRSTLTQSENKLSGDVETDGAYFGGKGRGGKDNKHQREIMAKKAKLMGALQRKGEVRMSVVPDLTADIQGEFIRKNIEQKGTRLMTDATNRLNSVAMGYDRHSVDHSKQEFVRGAVHVNSLDSFLAHVKRSIKGTHKVVSKKYLQSYLDGFVWHYNKRYSDRERFVSLLGKMLRGAGA